MRLYFIFHYALTALFLFFTFSVFSQNKAPRLQIPFGHTWEVNGMDISPNGKLIATAGQDRTVIIWDAETGKELKTLFFTNQLNRVFFTADSKSIFVVKKRAYFSSTFSLYDIKSAKLISNYNFGGGINCTPWPIGNAMLIPSFSDVASKSFKEEDLFHPSAVYDFDKNKVTDTIQTGRMGGEYANRKGYDSQFLKYNNEYYLVSSVGRNVSVWDIKNLQKPYLITAVPDVVMMTTTSVKNNVYAAMTRNEAIVHQLGSNKPAVVFGAKEMALPLHHISLSADGKLLLTFNYSKETKMIYVWDIASQKKIAEINLNNYFSKYTIERAFNFTDLKFSPNGNYFVLCSGNGGLIFDTHGNLLSRLSGHAKEAMQLYFSENQQFLSPRIAKKADMDQMMSFFGGLLDAEDRKELDAEIKKEFLDKQFYFNVWDLKKLRSYPALIKDDKIMVDGRLERVTKDSVSLDKNLLVTSIDNFNNQKHFVDMMKTHNSDFNSSEENDSDSYEGNMLAALFEKTSKLSESKGKLKLLINKRKKDTLRLVSLDSLDWIIINSEGYYKCSKNAATKLHYVTKDDKVVSFEQLDLKYNRPDKVLRSLDSTDDELISAYEKTHKIRLERYGFDSESGVGELEIPEADFPERDAIPLSQTSNIIEIKISGSSKSGLLNYNVWINEVPLYGIKGKAFPKEQSSKFSTIVPVTLSEGRNKIDFSVTNKNGIESLRRPLYVTYTPAVKPKPKTWFIGIGVNKYNDASKNNLKYTLYDIRSLSSELNLKLNGTIIIDTLFNDRFTVDNLNKIKAKLLNSGVDDRVIMVYSGHGVFQNNKYYFPTSEMNSVDFSKPSEKAIPYEVLESLLDGIQCRNKLFLIDACRSGNYDSNAETVLDSTTTTTLMEELFTYIGRGNGATIIASSSGLENSLESSVYKHGFMTQGLLDAIKSKPSICVSELMNYVLTQVPILSENKHPLYAMKTARQILRYGNPIETNTQNMKKIILSITKLILLAIVSQAHSQDKSAQVKIPFGHINKITSVDVSSDGKLIVTSSGDRTVAIWDAGTGKELRTLFLKNPVTKALFTADGKSLFIVESPKIMQCNYSIWDAKTAVIQKKLDFDGTANCAVSPAGNLLLIPGVTKKGLLDPYIDDTPVGKLFEKAKSTKLLNTKGIVYDFGTSVVVEKYTIGTNDVGSTNTDEEYAPQFMGYNGKMYIVSARNYNKKPSINIFDVYGKGKERSIKTEDKVDEISTSRDNGMYAVLSKHKVTIWSMASEKPLATFNSSDVQSANIQHINISADGKQLLTYSSTKTTKLVHIFDIATHKILMERNVQDFFRKREGSIGLKLAPTGKFFIMRCGNKALVFDRYGNFLYELAGHVAETGKLYFSQTQQFLSGRLNTKAEIDSLFALIQSPEQKKILEDKLIANDGKYSARVWDLAKAVNRPVAANYEKLVFGNRTELISRDTVSTNKSLILSSIDNYDRAVALKNDFDELKSPDPETQRSIDSIINRPMNLIMNLIEPDGKVKLLVNKAKQDTLRLITLDAYDWIIINKRGYYKSSKNAVAKLHYVTADDKIISFEQLDLKYNRPDLILESMGSKDLPMIEAYRKTYQNRLERYGVDGKSIASQSASDVPDADFPDRESIPPVHSTETIELRVSGSSKSALVKYNVWVNEVPIFGAKGKTITDGKNVFSASIPVTLSNGRNKIEFSVRDKNGIESLRRPLYIIYEATQPQKSKTWLIGIGVNKYADASKNTLKYTISDIRSLVKEFKNRDSEIEVDTLFNASFTLENLNKIKDKLKSSGVNDKVILIYSGHGIFKNQNYYFPTTVMNAADFKAPQTKAIAYETVEQILNDLPARNKLFLIDACRSGVYDPKGETVLDDTTTTTALMEQLFTYAGRGNGATIIASSTGLQESLESAEFKHGIMTQCILNAFQKMPTATVDELKDYILEEVPALSPKGNVQIPAVRSENYYANFNVW